jgi:hypothetical protein
MACCFLATRLKNIGMRDGSRLDFGIAGGAADPVFVPFRTISKPHFAHRLDCPAANVRVNVAHDGFIADEACTSPFYRLEATNRANTLKICKPNSRPFLC